MAPAHVHFLPACLQPGNNTEQRLFHQLGRRTRAAAAATPMIIGGLPAQQLT